MGGNPECGHGTVMRKLEGPHSPSSSPAFSHPQAEPDRHGTGAFWGWSEPDRRVYRASDDLEPFLPET